MVRLGVAPGERFADIDREFQFQYGTIGGKMENTTLYLKHTFQFQYGTIGGQLTRLLADAAELFQFQYGTIGGAYGLQAQSFRCPISIPVWYDWGIPLTFSAALPFTDFNSSMVRLGARSRYWAFSISYYFNSSMVRLGGPLLGR